MMSRRAVTRLAPILLAMFVLTGCLDELATLFEIMAYEESDDPEVREVGKTIREIEKEREARDKIDQFLETGDRRFLEDAKALRPDDTQILGYEVVLATQGGDPAEIEAAKQALALAEARRLNTILEELGDEPATARQLHRNVLGEILVAQTHLLGGSLTQPWEPPGPDAPPERQQLFSDYCATRTEIQTEYDDSLSYIPLPPCPPA